MLLRASYYNLKLSRFSI